MLKTLKSNLLIIIGNLIYAIGVNVFITPLNLYSGGVYGFCQIIRTYIEPFIPYKIDVAGIIYMIVNIPLLILAYKKIGKKFFFKTLWSVIICNVFLTFIVVDTPILEDVLVNCIIGGILAGIGAGLTLRAGSSGGGTDIIGMYLVKKKAKLGIGQIGLIINLFLFSYCAFIFSLETAIYSMIFSAIIAVTTDKLHSQNININAIIFTDNYEIAKEINKKLVRGSTSWEGKGDYTNNKKYVISTVITKYEENELKNIIKELDPNAFVIINTNVNILGYIEKRLDA